ncbi:MAG TPA: hypothetical protein VK955_01840, partial [Xanthobacteraceae bacterium]|nr:hypothetical protein [Xanthobacteraceae bacterium]
MASVGCAAFRARQEFSWLFRRLDCALGKHISGPIIDKPASVPDDRSAAAGGMLVNDVTATAMESAAAKAPDGLIEVRVTAIR